MTEAGGVTRCLACGAVETTPVGTTAKGFDSDEGGRRYHQPDYGIRHCANCGLDFKSHTIALTELGDYYQRHDEGIYEYADRLPTDRQLDRYLSQLPAGSRVLDFGCSTGRILQSSSSRLDCYGVEPNPRAAVIASQRGIQIIPESRLPDYQPEGFDAILLADVYEHLPQPAELLARLVGLLRPGAWLAVVTGNADAIRDRALMAEFWYFRVPAHLLMLSERHLHWLADRFGLELAGLHACSHYNRPRMERVQQHARAAAYARLGPHQHGLLSRALRKTPFINRAGAWLNAPVLDCTPDHVVAVFRKPALEPVLESAL